jgi:uncharacterized iron-regulated membrane protein
MAGSTLASLRRLWFNVHLWIGLLLFVFLVALGVSGTAMAWRPQLDRLLHPARYEVSRSGASLTPSAYLAAATTALGPDASPSRMAFSPTPGGSVTVMGFGAGAPGGRPALIGVWLDAADGHVLDKGPLMGGFIGLMHDLHGQMLIPGVGRQVVGWLGVAMLIQSLTGLWLWWPRVGGVKTALAWKRSAFLSMRLHHLAGVLMMIPLAVLSVTGIWIAFPQIGRTLAGPPPAAAGPARERGPRFAPPIAAPRLTADQAVDSASAEGPDGARILSIAPPTQSPSPAWMVQLAAPGAERPVTVRVSDETGEVLRGGPRGPGAGGPPGGGGGSDPLARTMREIHEGEGGLWWKLIVSLAGFAPALLGTTGLIRWLGSRRKGAAA